MAEEILRPNAAGDECNIDDQTGASCPNHYQNVDEAVSDDDTTTVETDNKTYLRDLYNIADHSVGSDTINKITVYVRCKMKLGSNADPNLKIVIKAGEGSGAPDTISESAEKVIPTTSWADFSNEWTTNPKTSNAFTWDEIDKVQAGLSINRGDGSTDAICTQLWVVVDYTLANVEVTPDPAAATATVSNPTVLMDLSVTPAAAAATIATINNPTVLMDLSITPAAAAVIATVLAPTVILGNLSITPAVAAAIATINAPAVVLDSTSKTPSEAAAIATTLNPVVAISTASTVTDWKTPNSASYSVRGEGRIWYDTDEVKVEDSDDAYCDINQSSYSSWLVCYNFQFGAGDIPAGATVDGIEVKIRHRAEYEPYIKDSALYLRNSSGVRVGDNKDSSSYWDTSYEYPTYGAPEDDWNASLTRADILSALFGIELSALNTYGSLDIMAYVDCVWIRVHYTLGALAITPSPSSAIATIATPTVALGSTSKTPDPAAAIATTVDPVFGGDILFTPSPASAIADVVAPVVLPTALTITPDAAAAIATIGVITAREWWRAATLLEALRAPSVKQLVKVVLTEGANEYTYYNARILEIEHEEQPYSHTITILLDNSDRSLNDIDFKGYKVVRSFGATTSIGDEYCDSPPLWVVSPKFISSPGKLLLELKAVGIPNLMEEDEASCLHEPDEDDTDTVKTIIGKVAGATLSCFTQCKAYNVVWDSEDSLIDTYIPKDGFRIYKKQSRLSAFRRLLDYTKCVARFGADGKIHILNPDTTSSSYAAEYSLAKGSHPFFSKAYRNSLVMPNKISVSTPDGAETPYSGSATDSESYALIPKTQYEECSLESNAQAANIAAAILSKYQLHSQTGAATIPLDVGLQVFDRIKVTDSRQQDARVGNVGVINHHYLVSRDTYKVTWTTTFSFGGWLSMRKILKDIEVHGIASEGQNFTRLYVKDLYAENIQADNIDMIWLDPEGNIDLSQIGDTIDSLPDGEVYARVKSLHIDAGQIKLDEYVLYSSGYNPTDKLDKTNDSLDDVPDGTTYQRVKSAALSASGLVLLDEVTAGTYELTLATDLSAGHLKLTSSSVFDATWYSEAGVTIDADDGIEFLGDGAAHIVWEHASSIYETEGGDLYIGAGDELVFLGYIYSSLNPRASSPHTVGDATHYWSKGYFVDLYADTTHFQAYDDIKLIRDIESGKKPKEVFEDLEVEKPKMRQRMIEDHARHKSQILELEKRYKHKPDKKAKIKQQLAHLESKYEADIAALDALTEPKMAINKGVSLAIGTIAKLADKLDAIESRLAILEAE